MENKGKLILINPRLNFVSMTDKKRKKFRHKKELSGIEDTSNAFRIFLENKNI